MKVHLVGNAHLDPAWLWSRHAGTDTALATARSACERLDEYPEFVFTCSGSWFHEQVERLDPALFGRMRRHVDDGRWQIVGGTVIQPDCNLPLAESSRRQFEVGQAYFLRAFGRKATVGYNVDSFGHCAYIPRFLRDAGLGHYVFMRPGPHEKELPAELFRWRSPDGAEVVAFRIQGAYTTGGADISQHIEAAIEAAPRGVGHTMCFFGVGDHGGGPTKAQIEWLIENRHAVGGAELVLSHPAAFFEAIGGNVDGLPVVEGELQHHAVGCYSVERRIKVAMRRAEAALLRAERAAETADCPPALGARLPEEWRAVLFNQFHDILGGTCIDRADAEAAGRLGGVAAFADDVTAAALRASVRETADPGRHQIVAVNLGARPFDGWVEHEPWFAGRPVGIPRLRDEDGIAVPLQIVEPTAKVAGVPRLLFRLAIPAGARRILDLTDDGGSAWFGTPPDDPPAVGGGGALLAGQAAVNAAGAGVEFAGWRMSLEAVEDPSDTWSHEVGRCFRADAAGVFEPEGPWRRVECGPLRDAVRSLGRFGNSRAWWRLALTRDEAIIRVRLRIVWAEERRRLRLRIQAPGAIEERTDLVSGGPVVRPPDREEYPLTGGLVVAAAGRRLGIAAPEVFSVAVDSGAVNLTLVRSPYMAHHEPMPAERRLDVPVTDQGYHEIELAVWPGCPDGTDALAALAGSMLMPLEVFDLTG